MKRKGGKYLKYTPSLSSNASSFSNCTSISTKDNKDIIEKLKNESLRNSTKRNYYLIWKLFNRFFLKLDNKPTSWEDRLTLFVGHLVHTNHQSQTIKSYLSAIRNTLRMENIKLNEDQFLLNTLTRACCIKNDTVFHRMAIQKAMLRMLVRGVDVFFNNRNQPYLATLYAALISTAYFGLFRVGELTSSPHIVKVSDVHLGTNKKKFLFVLRSSKTHDKNVKPQKIKISSQQKSSTTGEVTDYCPYQILHRYMQIHPRFRSCTEQFFIFKDFSPVKPYHFRNTLKLILGVCGFKEE